MPKKFIKLFVDGSFIYIPLGYLVWSISTHTGDKEGYADYFFNYSPYFNTHCNCDN